MAIEVKTKKWGNSIGVIIPSGTVEELKIKPDEKIVIEVRKKENILREMFGKAKFNKPTEQVLKEVREELKSKWM